MAKKNNSEVSADTKVSAEIDDTKNKTLLDTDEIEVISLIPNVSYKDSHSGDFYEWDSVGHSEYLTFQTLKNMWRNSKGYFKNMYLKPLDERVIERFNLKNVYDKYEFLMDSSNYTKSGISKVCETISSSPNSLKFAICNKIKELIVAGEISDIFVIRSLEKQFNLDLAIYID